MEGTKLYSHRGIVLEKKKKEYVKSYLGPVFDKKKIVYICVCYIINLYIQDG